jgi:hypothetical protein
MSAGKGPLRDYYMNEVASMKLSSVRIVSLWLAAEDYPILLGRSATKAQSFESFSSHVQLSSVYILTSNVFFDSLFYTLFYARYLGNFKYSL